ncbi:hypothetical protein PAERUG_E6_London_17_VIM_2_12_12_04706 [Pseudomonas aeruginosa]|nr:hypothetical protein PAERUG_E6_London_17_VIM_2_12_12_04706 [Pseudomonas aeruginosa]
MGEAQYKHYEADVPERYETTQVKRENGQIVFDSEGKPVIEHKAGDIVYNPDGTMRLLYRRGIDIVYENGVPVELEPRKLKYYWDFIALSLIHI